MKKLKYIFFSLCVTVLTLGACTKNERLIFNEKQSLYFTDFTDTDSLIYSFTMTEENIDTINVNITLLGQPLKEDTPYSVTVLPNSTAKEGIHYKPFVDNYIIKKGTVETTLPIIVQKSEDLLTSTVELAIQIKHNEIFGEAFIHKNLFRLQITNQLIQPSYWNNLLNFYFGDYSKVKHQKCIDIMGHDFPILLSQIIDYGYYMRAGRKAASYFAENKTLDENGQTISVWAPL